MNKKRLYIYYSFLFALLLFTWARLSLIPTSYRIAFLALLFVPIVFNTISLFFPCLVLFLTTTLLSFAGYTFMPTEIIYYILISFVFALVAIFHTREYYYPYPLFILLIVLTLAVNIVTSGTIEKVSYAFLLMVLVSITILGKDREMVIRLIPQAFIISTFACAVLTLVNQQLLVQESYDYERIISGSLNYTCCTFGIGFVLAFRELFKTSSWVGKAFYILAMFVLLFTIILEASRGAILSLSIASIVMVLTQRIKLKTRIIIIAAFILIAFVMYNNQVLDLLIYRIQSDEGTGTGRTEIWAEKLGKFHASLSFSSALFGIGYENTWNLGGARRQFIGCHNDFIAFYIEYGLIGLFLFLLLILSPLIVARTKSLRADIAPLVVFVILTCLTLEPFSIGYLPFFFLLLFIYLNLTFNKRQIPHYAEKSTLHSS